MFIGRKKEGAEQGGREKGRKEKRKVERLTKLIKNW